MLRKRFLINYHDSIKVILNDQEKYWLILQISREYEKLSGLRKEIGLNPVTISLHHLQVLSTLSIEEITLSLNRIKKISCTNKVLLV